MSWELPLVDPELSFAGIMHVGKGVGILMDLNNVFLLMPPLPAVILSLPTYGWLDCLVLQTMNFYPLLDYVFASGTKKWPDTDATVQVVDMLRSENRVTRRCWLIMYVTSRLIPPRPWACADIALLSFAMLLFSPHP